MAATLIDWLASRSPRQLAQLLSRRPETRLAPLPRDLAELADQLAHPGAVAAALHLLPVPALQVIEVLQLLGPGRGDRTALATWLGRDPADASVDRTLDQLAGQALAWPEGDTLRMVEPLYDTFRYPLGLGAPAEALLNRCSAEQLRGIARRLGLPTHGRKSDLVGRVEAFLCEPERVRTLTTSADPRTRDRLRELAITGPDTDHLAGWYPYYEVEPALRWAVERGLVLPDSWGVPQPPREVAVALRGPGWHAPFSPDQPVPALTQVFAADADRDSAAAGAATVEALCLLLAAVDAAPVAMLKSGGVGVRELRRLARATGLAEPALRLWLELAYEAGLLAVVPDRAGGGELLPTSGYDEWAARDPAGQLAAVLPAWLSLDCAPLLPAGHGEPKPPAPLLRDHNPLPAAIRRSLLRLLDSLPAEQGIADPTGLATLLEWTAPLELAAAADPAGLAAAVWAEAELLGVVARGALTPLGRVVAQTRTAELADACQRLLPAATGQAVFQADLSALVPGFPARALAELLDAAADRESGGGAVTWRFSPGSVRRALDAGWQAGALLAALVEHAAGGKLPQPLTYLVNDVARRHGAVRVRAVGCVLHASDPALIAELAGARALRPLGLVVLAPTVLTSPAPVERVLTALRDAGYAPVAEGPDGGPQLARIERRRADVRPGGRRPTRRPAGPVPVAPDPVDLEHLAEQLLAAPLPVPATAPLPVPATAPAPRRSIEAAAPLTPPVGPAADLAGTLARQAAHLDTRERGILLEAIENTEPVMIAYIDRDGEHTVRVIDSIELDGGHLVAWCQLREDERRFALHRIAAVAPP